MIMFLTWRVRMQTKSYKLKCLNVLSFTYVKSMRPSSYHKNQDLY